MQLIDTSDIACERRAQLEMQRKHRAQMEDHHIRFGELGVPQRGAEKARLKKALAKDKAKP